MNNLLVITMQIQVTLYLHKTRIYMHGICLYACNMIKTTFATKGLHSQHHFRTMYLIICIRNWWLCLEFCSNSGSLALPSAFRREKISDLDACGEDEANFPFQAVPGNPIASPVAQLPGARTGSWLPYYQGQDCRCALGCVELFDTERLVLYCRMYSGVCGAVWHWKTGAVLQDVLWGVWSCLTLKDWCCTAGCTLGCVELFDTERLVLYCRMYSGVCGAVWHWKTGAVLQDVLWGVWSCLTLKDWCCTGHRTTGCAPGFVGLVDTEGLVLYRAQDCRMCSGICGATWYWRTGVVQDTRLQDVLWDLWGYLILKDWCCTGHKTAGCALGFVGLLDTEGLVLYRAQDYRTCSGVCGASWYWRTGVVQDTRLQDVLWGFWGCLILKDWCCTGHKTSGCALGFVGLLDTEGLVLYCRMCSGVCVAVCHGQSCMCCHGQSCMCGRPGRYRWERRWQCPVWRRKIVVCW